jgi:glycosyltransferase involved in cell wall biosynthesis
MRPEITIGITTWNSALFLPTTLNAIRKTTAYEQTKVVVFDNCSTDVTCEIANSAGAHVIERSTSQAEALSTLLRDAKTEFVLLMHSDVVLLNVDWLEICAAQLNSNQILISPEDIGCGPWSRPFGRGKPESSFMFFHTRSAQNMLWRHLSLIERMMHPRRRGVDFTGEHITHLIPAQLEAQGYSWRSMKVHASPEVDACDEFRPAFKPSVWREDLGRLRYALGNFYSVDNTITHYHNWYDRVVRDVQPDSTDTTGRDQQGFPLAFVALGTRRFLTDYANDRVALPVNLSYQPEPRAL